MVITAENFTKICRLCLSERSDLIKFYHQTDVIKRLSECTAVKVHRNDNLPKLICTLCLCQLNTSYTFKKLCESSDAELRRFLSEKQQEKILTKEDVSACSRENSIDRTVSETSSEPAGAENFHDDEVSEDAADDHSKTIESKRRRMCCLFCKKYVDSLPKHLVTVHPDEDDVIEFQKYPSRSRKRLSIIGLIRRQGNYNARIKEKKAKGAPHHEEPEKPATGSVEYFPCNNCLGYYSKAMLMNHMRNCRKKTVSSRRTVTSSTNIPTSKLSASKILATCILPLIRSDSVLKQIKSDPLILMYGSELCIRNDIKRNSVKIRIRKLIRQIARLLIAMKKANSSITQLMDIFDTKYIDVVMAVLDDIAEYNSETNTYTKYNLAAGLGAGLKKCANIIIANAVIRGNETLRSMVMNYLKLFDVKFGKKFRNSSRKVKREITSDEEKDPLDVSTNVIISESAEVPTLMDDIIDNDPNFVVVKQELLGDQFKNEDEDEKNIKQKEDSDAESMSSLPTTLSENEEDSMESDKEKSGGKKKRKNDEDDTPSSSRKKQVRRSWSTIEQLAVRKHFSDLIEMGIYPTKQQVMYCLTQEPCLQSRTWQQVKAWISNQHRTVKRDLSKSMMEME